MRIFVNGRAIRDRMIIHAITEGLRGFLMKGKNPSGLIHLSLPPDEVDVNVHPAKHEVRFRNSRDVHTLLSQSVAEAMREHQLAIKATIFRNDQSVERTPVPLGYEPIDTRFFESPVTSTKQQPPNDFSRIRLGEDPPRRSAPEEDVFDWHNVPIISPAGTHQTLPAQPPESPAEYRS